MSKSPPKGLTFQASKGLWMAQHKGHRVTYSTTRYGGMAKELASRALERMRAGTFDPIADDLLFKQSWKMDDAARQLGLSLTQLRQWMVTGTVNGKEIHPPKRDVRGVDRITGHELMMVQLRLAT
ncbi:hypothetical protein CF112_00930 [Aeromonas hydrophila]|nr:hypothetical protein CF112_00930 [Aeromonas hydrophila]